MTSFQRYFLALLAIIWIAAGSGFAALSSDIVVGAAGKPISVTTLGKAALGIKLVTVEKQSLPMEVAVPGKIDVIPTRQFDQHAPLSGRISSVNVAPGEMVKQGQILAVIESPEMNQMAAQLLQSRLDIESEIARQQSTLNDDVRQAEERFNLAESNYGRIKKLHELKIAAEKDVLAAGAEFQIDAVRLKTANTNKSIMMKTLRARLELTLAPLRQRLEMLGVNEQEIEAMIKQQKTLTEVPVKAARSGFVTNIAASAGKNIDPSVSLFTIADLSKVWATADIYEDDMARMRVGQLVHVKVHAMPGENVDGTLTFIGTQVDPGSRTLPVRAQLDNSQYRLKPDMYADLYIETSSANPVFALPHDAVVQHGAHSMIFLDTPSGYVPTYVKTGRSVGNLLEITDGLNDGDKVVTQGAFQLAAEKVKNSGGAAMFLQATEADHGDEEVKKPSNGLNMSIQSVVIIVAGAFLFGFAVSAVFLFRSKHHVHPGTVAGRGLSPAAGGETGQKMVAAGESPLAEPAQLTSETSGKDHV